MSTRELIVLSPYRLPTQHELRLGREETAALLNAFSVLWHPAALDGAAAPPRIASPYDFEHPSAGQVFALPESPPLVLPDDWDERVQAAGAVAFRASADRSATLANLREAFTAAGLPFAEVAPETQILFTAVGFGRLVLDTLFEAMEHQNVLAAAEFWQDVSAAVAALSGDDADAPRRHLQAAAQRLLLAREVLYPVTIYLLDLLLLEERPAGPLAATFYSGLPCNVLACGAALERFGHAQPELLRALAERIQAEQAEVCGGPYQEREDALLPVETQLWNLMRGLTVSRQLLGKDVQVFARRRFGAHPQLPVLLHAVGLRRAVLLAFDESTVPTYRVTVTSWSSADGRQLEVFTRAPHAADDPQTFFHLAHALHKTIMQDHSATLAFVHRAAPAAPWYDDLVALSQLAPVLGRWTTLSAYLGEVYAGEYASPSSADEFHGDYLGERIDARRPDPVSGFARQARARRQLDTAWTLAALHRGLAGREDTLALDCQLSELEDRLETGGECWHELEAVQAQAAAALANRLLSRARAATPGLLILNPCSFPRRVALEIAGITGILPVEGPLKAFQPAEDMARLVVEVPALGFSWIPRHGPAGPPPPVRMRLADERSVRNEFFEAQIDPTTGGLRALYDHRTRINRLGQQLVFNPGSIMLVKQIRVTSAGPALGEVICEGAILDEQENMLASYRQRYRVWLGRPVLELRIDIDPIKSPEGYPWYAYYGARFAWRDERATLLRGLHGPSFLTANNRPETAEYLELRHGRQSTCLFPGGLPFHQRHGPRMVDVLLLPEGETARTFDLALALDREYPMQTAQGMVTPVPVVPTAQGPPHVGPSGWLFHLNAPNQLLTSLRPAAAGADAVVARLLECAGHSGQSEFRFARHPLRAQQQDVWGTPLADRPIQGDAVLLEVAAGDLIEVRVDFS